MGTGPSICRLGHARRLRAISTETRSNGSYSAVPGPEGASKEAAAGLMLGGARCRVRTTLYAVADIVLRCMQEVA